MNVREIVERGRALAEAGRFDEAGAAFRQLLALLPHSPHARNELANVLQLAGKLPEAVAVYREAISLSPLLVDPHCNLSRALLLLGDAGGAVAEAERAVALDPSHPAARNNLGEALRALGRYGEARLQFEAGLKLAPQRADAFHHNLGGVALSQGRVADAITHLRLAVAAAPVRQEVQSDLLYALHYTDADAGEIAAEHARWANAFAVAGNARIAGAAQRPDAGGRLRVGYVSADFWSHAAAHFLDPLLALDRSRFEVFCYSNAPAGDVVTARLRAKADAWRSIYSLPDAAAEAAIRGDGIDVLVDLSVHTGGNRLPLLARRPAPVQVTYLGYPGTTGLPAMNYRVTDPHLGGAGEGPEQLLTVPSYFCYRPPDESAQITPLPADAYGRVTFGSLNRLAKLSQRAVETWGRILAAVRTSRLLLMAIGLADGETRELVAARFAAAGVTADRLDLVAPGSMRAYLATLGRVDVALDPFPFNGGTTTLHALWMGVPVVALAGERAVSRMGVSILTLLGLPELVAQSPEEYVRVADTLARDLPRLRELRRTLRERLKGSPLMDQPSWTRAFEAALLRVARPAGCTRFETREVREDRR